MNRSVSPERLAQVKRAVDLYLRTYCEAQTARAMRLHPDFGRLWQAITDVVGAGGKRLRPYLTMLAYEGFGGKQTDAVLQIACAWELLHISILMHDDVIDRDYMRHGQLNVAGRLREAYKAYPSAVDSRTHFADGGAIMAGDALLAAGHHLIMTSSLSADQKTLATELLANAVFAVAGGEILDTEAAMQPLATVNAQLIAELKTAEYSIIGPLLTGAKLAGTNDATSADLRELGRLLGIAYQFADDLLDIIGDAAKTGKGVGHDLREGKRTELLKITHAHANEDDQKTIDRILAQNTILEQDAAALKEIILRTKAVPQLQKHIAEYKLQALELLAKLPMQQGCKAELKWLVGYALDRES